MWVSSPARATTGAAGPLTAPSTGETTPRENPNSLLGRLASIAARSLAATLLFGIPIAGQSPGIPVPQPGLDHGQSSSRFPMQSPGDAGGNSGMQAKQIKALNLMRHKQMVDDSAKLLLLAKQLNEESGSLSPSERVHKAAEIEKLAKSVKDKMSYAVGNETRVPVFTVVSP